MENLYPRVRQVIEEGRVPEWNKVRYEMFKRLGNTLEMLGTMCTQQLIIGCGSRLPPFPIAMALL